ncbi:PREDICTED: EF-hand domain-containing family member C2-like [Priapulus caudatus]|uniref:EF-hand domain-containing family member C2 n=1 Tax=Priapulus caudatus TaxID=37621 RepID=A0ABM1EXF9_PRICU|nr:PREDICTED: EF-hand domain-containing family member C2-like [Priapulus caudatus]
MSLFTLGTSATHTQGTSKFHKSHHFDYQNEVAMLVADNKSGSGSGSLESQLTLGGVNKPAWVAFDKQVLCFDAYFQESVQERQDEQYRIRNCKIYFHLEDDSVQVTERRVENSGIPQGTLIRRSRIPLPPPNENKFYTVEHFNIGKDVVMYNRSFKITNCDAFTVNFLTKLGIKVSQPISAPEDPYIKNRKEQEKSMQPLRPYEKYDTMRQFMDHDKHVLRFFCYWDDSDSMFGDSREMILYYFLADDTIEISEVIPPNSGRDATAKFLRRARLPKDIVPLHQPGEATSRTVLNVFGQGKDILDSLKTGAVPINYYTDADLQIGAVLNVWGRKFILCDCDEFTKMYYSTKCNIQDFTSVKYKTEETPAKPKTLPPYNGFGSEEDSRCSCMGLIPKPPRRDFKKFMEKDRRGLDSNVLRFIASLDTKKTVDRQFVISYFLSDDTIAVFEPPQRNSGVIGGKFLERGRIKRQSESDDDGCGQPEFYTASDLYVGARVEFNNHKFVLIDADEYAFRYMEKQSDEFPQAGIDAIVKKLQQHIADSPVENLMEEIRRSFTRNDVDASGFVYYEQFHNLLVQFSSGKLSEHEVITLGRYYGEKRPEELMDINTMAALAQQKIRRKGFENFAQLCRGLLQRDSGRTGLLNPNEVLQVCRAFRLPAADMVKKLIGKIECNEQGLMNYNDLVSYLNWRENPMPVPENTDIQVEDGGSAGKSDNLYKVNYTQFLELLMNKDTSNN